MSIIRRKMFTCRVQVISFIDTNVFFVVCIIFFHLPHTSLTSWSKAVGSFRSAQNGCPLKSDFRGRTTFEARKCSPVGYRLIVRSSFRKCSTWFESVLRKENTKVNKMSVKAPCRVSNAACTTPLAHPRVMLCMHADVGNAWSALHSWYCITCLLFNFNIAFVLSEIWIIKVTKCHQTLPLHKKTQAVLIDNSSGA